MTSAASIAQFMAMMSGVNPSALKKNMDMLAGQTDNKKPDFTSMVQGQAAPQQKQGITPENIAVVNPVARGASVVQMPVQKQELNTASILNMQLPEGVDISVKGEIILSPNVQVSDLKKSALEEIVALALQVKGVSDEGIKQLQDVFGDEVLFTILQDPILSAQLDKKLAEVGIISFEKPEVETVEDIESKQLDDADLIALVSQVLIENPRRVENTISFKVDEEKQINDLVKTLIQTEGADAQNLSFEIVETVQPLAPNFMALVKVAMTPAHDKGLGQKAMPVSVDGFNPFGKRPVNLFAQSSGNANPLPHTNIEAVLQSVMDRNPQNMTVESIAERMAGMMNNAQNAATSSVSFDAMMAQFAGDNAIMSDMDGMTMMPLEAAMKTAQQATNPLLSAQPALAQSHPATHMVAMSMVKFSAKGLQGEDIHNYRLQLDPPEMGRLDIQLEMIEQTGQMKAVISAEKPETLGMLQRDMHVLLKAMQDAGFENMSQQDFTFNLSQDGFDMAGGRDGGKGGQEQPLLDGDLVEMEIVDTEMSVIIDPVTGQRSVNMVV
jgi:hypothetical protein